MLPIIPISLSGENLGQRHLHFNSIVNNSYKNNEDFQKILILPEKSPIDRILKIDLASKHRCLDYIFENLKDEDTLFVARALKSEWLLESKYENVFNPKYLDESLFPSMTTTAVIKLKRWLCLNLKDERRCKQFYQFYRDKSLDYAIKFLVNCDNSFMEEEFSKIVHKINPHYFKILCEKTTRVAKIFFDSLSKDQLIINLYLKKPEKYFDVLRHILKSDTELVLDIVEKYFDKNRFKPFSSSATKHIMNNYRARFFRKPELYTVWILNINTLSCNLNAEEIKDLLIKLAKAKYLTYLGWFSYKNVEPLIKRLSPEERVKIKNQIFVQKDFGEDIENWQYEIPAPPVIENIESASIFDDRKPNFWQYSDLGTPTYRMLMKRSMKYAQCAYMTECIPMKMKSFLDKLFDEYRFANFGKTLYELRKKMAAESSSMNREFMMLVLVSKSGGRPEAVASLMELLLHHINEPPNVRAAVIRSLVKRAFAWRFHEDNWNKLLEFGRGLGLDGSTPEADCSEGLHAVVIRSLLNTGECSLTTQKSYLQDFSDFSTYSLSTSEKKQISDLLPKMLIKLLMEENDTDTALTYVDKLLDTLNVYHIKIETYPDVITKIASLSENNIKATTSLLRRLFEAKIARRQLFKYNFEVFKTDASYLNALKHDLSVLQPNNFLQDFTNNEIRFPEQFFQKIALYFEEEGGLASKFLSELKSASSNKNLGRPLSILLKSELINYIKEKDSSDDINAKLLASSLRGNAHKARPFLDIHSFGWEKCGAKCIANRILKCPDSDIDNNVKELLKFKRFAKLAMLLSQRNNSEIVVIDQLSKIRPSAALKVGLKIIKTQLDNVDIRIWEVIRPIIEKQDPSKIPKWQLSTLKEIDSIPLKVRPEYSVALYTMLRKKCFYDSMTPLCHIEILLPKIDEQFIESMLNTFIEDYFTFAKLEVSNHDDNVCTSLYLRILIKYIHLSKNEDIQKQRIEKFGNPIFKVLEKIYKGDDENKHKYLFKEYTNDIFLSLKYNYVFLDMKYASPLPLIERIVTWMQNLIPIEQNFEQYTHVHLTMLYYKAIRHSMNFRPDVFDDEKKKIKEGQNIVGDMFGKFIAQKVKILTEKYFESVIDLYGCALFKYMYLYFDHQSSEFLASLIKGIIAASDGPIYRLGINFLVEKKYNINNDHIKDIVEMVKETKNEEATWFILAEIKV